VFLDRARHTIKPKQKQAATPAAKAADPDSMADGTRAMKQKDAATTKPKTKSFTIEPCGPNAGWRSAPAIE
jgi:hypothetical protein